MQRNRSLERPGTAVLEIKKSVRRFSPLGPWLSNFRTTGTVTCLLSIALTQTGHILRSFAMFED